MTCDEFFDRLTGAASSRDASLDEHSADCPRCRSLAETLQPALELFRAAVTEHEPSPFLPNDGPPAWLCEHDSDAPFQPAAESSWEPTRRVVRRPSLPRSGATARRLVAAIVCGVLLGGTMWTVFAGTHRSHESTVGMIDPVKISQIPGRRQGRDKVIDSLKISRACLQHPGREPLSQVNDNPTGPVPLAQIELDGLECCTLCHAQGRSAATSCDASRIALSCRLCHIQ